MGALDTSSRSGVADNLREGDIKKTRTLPLGVERGDASRSELSTDRQSRSARSPDGAGEGPAGDRAARGGAGEGMVGSGVEGVAAEVAAGGWWSGSYGGTPSCPLAQL